MKLRRNGFDGYIFTDICCIIEDDENTATHIEEIVTSNFDGTDIEYVIIYFKLLKEFFSGELLVRLNALEIEPEDLIFVQV